MSSAYNNANTFNNTMFIGQPWITCFGYIECVILVNCEQSLKKKANRRGNRLSPSKKKTVSHCTVQDHVQYIM